MEYFKDFFNRTFYNNTVTDWAKAIIIILLAVIIGKITMWIIKTIVKKLTAKTKTKLDDILIDMAEEPLVFAIVLAGISIGLHTLNLSRGLNKVINTAYYILIIFNIAWLINRLFDAFVNEYLSPLVEKSESDFDDQLLPIIRKGVKASIWIIAIIVGLNNAGYDVGAVLAGLGIGGLAFALAAQDSIANLFGGFTIFADKPFKVKDRVKIEGFDGFIQEIGIRSTRLKTLEGRIVTIPNSKFTDRPVENVSSEPSRKIKLNLGLTYDTSDKNMEKAITILKDIIANNPSTEEEHYVSFNAFGDFSLGILLIYYIKHECDILNTQTTINLEILKQFNKNKLEFAFPTQTIYTQQG